VVIFLEIFGLKFCMNFSFPPYIYLFRPYHLPLFEYLKSIKLLSENYDDEEEVMCDQ
jgi:hypothetical protein